MMSSIEKLQALIFGDGSLGEWDASSRNRALLLGAPAILFALAGVLLLVFAQFGSSQSLESRYKNWLETSTKRKNELGAEIQREINMKLASQQSLTDAKLDDLIAPEDQRRVEFDRAKDEQRVYLRKLNAINPEESEYLFRLAKMTLEDQDIERGLAMMRKIAPTIEPGYLPAHVFLADWHKRRGAVSQPERKFYHITTAAKHYENILLREPNNKVALTNLGLIYFQNRDFKKAAPLFTRLFEIDPNQYKPVLDANSRINRENENVIVLEKAIAFFTDQLQELARDDDQRIVTLKNITECYLRQKSFTDAETLLKEEIAVFSQSADDSSRKKWAEKLLSVVYLQWAQTFSGEDRDNVAKRLDYLTLAYKFDPSNQNVLRQLTRVAWLSFPELADQAKAVYNPFEHADRPPLVINELGIQALSRSRYDEALAYFDEANKKAQGRNPEILNNLAYTYLKCSSPNPRQSLSLINDAIRFTPAINIPRFRSNFLDTRARAYMQLKNYTSAIADLSLAWRDRRDNQEIMQAIIDCYHADNLQKDAVVWEERLQEAKQKAAAEAARAQRTVGPAVDQDEANQEEQRRPIDIRGR